MVQRFKPAPEVYRGAAREMGITTRDMLMVAAHPWDLMGAGRAGCRTAFIARAGKAPLPGAPAPDYIAEDLRDLARMLMKPRRSGAGTAAGTCRWRRVRRRWVYWREFSFAGRAREIGAPGCPAGRG